MGGKHSVLEDQKVDCPTWGRKEKLNRKTDRNIHPSIEFDVQGK